MIGLGLVLWYLTPLSTYFSYFVAVSFIGGENRNTRRKPQTYRKSLSNFITQSCIEFTSKYVGFELTRFVVIYTDFTNILIIFTLYIWSQELDTSSKTIVACVDVIVVCNPINHVADKTLGSPTSKNTIRLSENHSRKTKTNRFVYIFFIESLLFLYYTVIFVTIDYGFVLILCLVYVFWYTDTCDGSCRVHNKCQNICFYNFEYTFIFGECHCAYSLFKTNHISS